MIQFNALKLSGFKSFVDHTELEIRPGLNGIVGPNGCGKSNIVEALRWVMGESSAKRMRGEGMEDVIFAGTGIRSARNIAEVTLHLDNSKRQAPAAFNSAEDIEVTRRIERDQGSSYKINGKNVRARDVQMLFADTVTGANSPALVSQGHITKIINSKPQERRLILEESAGISGLFARRHEAELRLKGADANLVRLEDIIGSTEERLSALKRQARQAARYRNINAQIRQLELALAYLEWLHLNKREEEAREKFTLSENKAAEKMIAVTQLTKTQTGQAAELPALRKEEAALAAALQNKKIHLQRIEDEAASLQQRIGETTAQLEQTGADQSHEQQMLIENEKLLENLLEEEKKLRAREEKAGEIIAEKEKNRDGLHEKLEKLEQAHSALMESVARSRAQKDALETQLAQMQERLTKIEDRKAQAEKALDDKKKTHPSFSAFSTQEDDIKALEKTLEETEKTIENLAAERSAAINACEKAQQSLNETTMKEARFTSEIKTLRQILENTERKDFTPVLDRITIQPGFEKTLSRALGDSLLASLEENAPSQWLKRTAIANLPSLPAGCKPMTSIVKAPEALALALGQIGYIENDSEGPALLNHLKPGQGIVSANGAYWRWDGFHTNPTAKDPFAVRLEQKNKLAELEQEIPPILEKISKEQGALEEKTREKFELEEKYTQSQAVLKKSAQELNEKRTALSRLKEQQSQIRVDMQRLEESVTLAAEEQNDLQTQIKTLKARLEAFTPAMESARDQKLNDAKQILLKVRETYRDAVRAFDMQQQEQNTRKARLQALSDERITVQNRTIRTKEHLKELAGRKEALEEKQNSLKRQPRDFKAECEKYLSEIAALEKARNEAAEALSRRENDVTETSRALKEAETALGEAREARAGAQATLAALSERREIMERESEETFAIAASALKTHITIALEGQDLEQLKAKKDKLERERESIGAVNLRADEEAQELEKDVAAILHERNDLTQAIEELRAGIYKINKEARERLLVAFEHVNSHFQSLFTRLFEGGKAYLSLIDSEDPLGAGLEIFAQPPGKSLQSLSLLSGGEQTMTSIALIIAMFLTNPSPICVLDEIDAPLDDANVDRVCDLLEEIAERGETRFLVITHHRLTMARMDYLYGVTMPEKGISQLVSVDLQQSFEFVEAA